MKRIIYYLLLIIALCFVSEVKAQNNYVKTNFGSEINDLNNLCLSVEFGHFFTPNSAFELEYAHGFKKENIYSNKIGINYLYEFDDDFIAPYMKMGVGYKQYSYKYSSETKHFNGADFKIGFGINVYITNKFSLSVGFDLSNTAIIYDSEWHWDWDSSLFTPKIGLSHNF